MSDRSRLPAVLVTTDTARAWRMVSRMPWNALVDRAARAERLALHDLPSAGAPAARGQCTWEGEFGQKHSQKHKGAL